MAESNRSPSADTPPHARLQAWQSAHVLVLAIYRATETWPSNERFELTSQIRRASISVATNIAEGAAKRGPREFCRYLDIALGSLNEVAYLLQLSRDLGYLPEGLWGELEASRDHTGRLLWGLYRTLSTAADRVVRRAGKPRSRARKP